MSSPPDSRSGPGDLEADVDVDVEVAGGGEASDEEVAAIVAAVEVAWPRPPADQPPDRSPRWRFSGRWWSKPVPLRRSRPWWSG